MKAQITKTGLVIIFAVFIFSACKKEKGESNEEEVITTMILNFVPVGGGTPLEFTFNDPDGPDGTNPTIDDIVLEADKQYDVTVTLLNVLADPDEDITEEVEEEGEAHRFYYQPSASGPNDIGVATKDTDANGIPLGILSTWTTHGATPGSVTITLRHYPGNPPDKQVADPVNSPKSSTDITVTFNTIVN
jgi:hypothetical protein